VLQCFSTRSKIATIAVLLLGACTTWVPAAAAGENYALIVAASDYPNLDKKFWLAGPKNDARLVRDFLVNNASVPFRPEDVTTLGSGEGLELATHQAILSNLNALAAKAKPGDFVFLQFSGHGSQQPAAADANEPDGRDEIFLSADAMLAPEGSSYLPNVLTDDELSVALSAIRSTGAFVWLIFDSCYSGTMTRGAPDDGRMVMRDIKPAELGIPDSAFSAAEVTSDGERAVPLNASIFEQSGSEAAGGLVAFFAAQSTETTPEKPYEVAREDGTVIKENYGVFTYTVFSELAKNPGLTYRQLAQSVLANYAAANQLKPTPLFEGDLDAPVFGSQDSLKVAQWPTVVGSDKTLTISAGQLHGLSKGAKLLLLPSPAASNADAIGVLEVSSSDQLRSKLTPSTDANGRQIVLEDVPVGAYVRLAEQTYPFELVVAKPDLSPASAAQIAEVEEALRQIVANAEVPMRLRVVEAGEEADVRLAVYTERQVFDLELQADRAAASTDPVSNQVAASGLDSSTPLLWLLPPSGDVSLKPRTRSASMDLRTTGTSEFVSMLSENLVTIFRATSLSRLTQASTFKPKDFELSFGVQEAGTKSIAILRSEATPVVRPGDRLFVNFWNRSGKSVDLNLLYVDADYGITLLCQAHLAKNDKLFQPVADLNESDRAAERIIAVINESGKDLTDLSFLEQRGIVVRTRGPNDEGLMGMIADLAAGMPTRGPTPAANPDTKQPRGAVVMLPLEVAAATGAEPAATLPLEAEPFTGSCQS
jgi:hypothetical protein